MPVDFTNKRKEKTNYEYLRDMLKGNEEGIEFLEGFDKEMKNIIEEKETRITDLEIELDAAEGKEPEYDNDTDIGFGFKESLRWSAHNLSVKSMMEELENCFERNLNPQQIEAVLRAL